MTTAAISESQRTTAPPPASAGRNVAVFTNRAVKRFVRRPDTVVSTLAFPLLLLLTMLAVFSSAVEAFEGGADYAQRLVPGLIVSGIMFGSLGTAVGFWVDLDTGFMDRVRSMPVTPLAPLVGTVAAEALRALMAVTVLVAVGHAFGFRFQAGTLPAVAFFVVGAAFGTVAVWIGLFLATVATSQEALGPPLSAVFLILLFFSEGLVPLDAYPGWAQPIVEANPATAYVRLLDHLARGGDLLGPTLVAVAWGTGIVILFGGLALRRLARRSQR